MTPNNIVRMLYAGAIGFLSVGTYGPVGLLIGPGIILVSHAIAQLFGRPKP